MDIRYFKYFILLLAILFIKHSIAQEVIITPDSFKAGDTVLSGSVKYIDDIIGQRLRNLPSNTLENKDSIAKSNTIQQQNQQNSKKITEDSIEQSNAIQQQYQQSRIKITEDSIVQSNAIQQQYQQNRKKMTEDSIAQSNAIQQQNQLNNSKTTTKSFPQSNVNQQKNQQNSKKMIEDSIAQSNAIQQQYQLITKKITEDSIAQSNAIQLQYQLINKRIADDSIALSLLKDSIKNIPNTVRNSSDALPTLTFDVGQVFSTYRFFDDQDNKEKELTNIGATGFSLGYHHPLQKGLFVRGNIGMRKGGASMIYEGLDVNWTVQYVDVSIGLGYIYTKKRLKPYFSLSPYFGYMQKGTQTIGADNYDIKKEKSMKTTDFGVFFSPGLKMDLSGSIACYAEYRYILGLQNIETSAEEKLFNRGFSISLGVAIKISHP